MKRRIAAPHIKYESIMSRVLGFYKELKLYMQTLLAKTKQYVLLYDGEVWTVLRNLYCLILATIWVRPIKKLTPLLGEPYLHAN